jgi:cysteine desulfurase
MVEALDDAWGNPSSAHALGRRARVLLDEAREKVAAALLCKPGEIVFTGGGTEANNLAVFGAARLRRDRGRHLISSPVEHHAVLHCLEYLRRYEDYSISFLPVDSEGRVNPEDVGALLRPDTVLVSVMAANNETGVVQPVVEIGRLCRERGVLFHSDALQWFGKEPLTHIDQFHADLIPLCAHKLHGPKGVGLLYVRSPLQPHPILFGGSHENERRAGTENLPAILGLAKAVVSFLRPPVFDPNHLKPLSDRLASVLVGIEGVTVHGSRALRLANTIAFTTRGADSIALLAALDLHGVCASSGSACATGALEPSHVLRAMGVAKPLAASLVRLSLGRENTVAEIDAVSAILPAVIAQVRGAAR